MVLGTAQTRHHHLAKSLDDILAAADKSAPGLAAQIRGALEEMRGQLPDIEDLIAAGDFDAVTRAISELPVPEQVQATLRDALASTATAAARPEVASFGIELNRVNERAVRWATRHAAEQVTAISGTTRRSVNDAIVGAMREGVGAKPLARHLESLIGLTPGHAKAVDRLFRSFDLDDPGQVRQALKVAGRKADKLLRWRAETIARTETIRAANMGQQLVWDQALDDGLLLIGAKKVWMATGDDRTCQICAVLDGETIEVSGEFKVVERAIAFIRRGDMFTVQTTTPLPRPTTTRTPPAHPRCRCTIIIEDIKAQRIEAPQTEEEEEDEPRV